MVSILATILGIVLVYMTCWYAAALYMRDNSIVDIAWGGAFIIATWTALIGFGPITYKGILVALLVTVWGFRLSGHIYARYTGTEDPRYAQWRRQWTYVKLRSFLQVFMLQGIISVIVASPAIYIASQPAQLHWFDLVGIAVWSIGMVFEVVADWQLQRFIETDYEPGAIMTSGLWRYSRHPNYFGESLIWWGMWLLSVSLPYGWIYVISPILITYLILYVSGIPMNEAQFADNPEYQKYKKETSAFIPLPPRNR